ncbi:hypothetical protein RIF29_03858 [Crotalaria pallida]|uniref:Uncharacterized protein n=1 Tax=Crotalaria pallida TaxID=3830 RepID=A0AAN9P8W4_CROPI
MMSTISSQFIYELKSNSLLGCYFCLFCDRVKAIILLQAPTFRAGFIGSSLASSIRRGDNLCMQLWP